MKNFIELYEDGEYHLSHRELLRSFKDGVTHEALIYLIKNTITHNDFEIPHIEHMKLLFFYYFFKLGKVEFTNDYSFSFNSEALGEEINISFLMHHKTKNFIDLKQYFHFGANEQFLTRVYDLTYDSEFNRDRDGMARVDNIVDFFLAFTHECSELYSFSGPHFPLFKWLINELCEDEH